MDDSDEQHRAFLENWANTEWIPAVEQFLTKYPKPTGSVSEELRRRVDREGTYVGDMYIGRSEELRYFFDDHPNNKNFQKLYEKIKNYNEKLWQRHDEYWHAPVGGRRRRTAKKTLRRRKRTSRR